MLLPVLAVVLGVLVACAGGTGGPVSRSSAGALPVLEVSHLQERALLLLMADRQVYEAFTVRQALSGPPDLRRDLADALGRIGDPEGLGMLRALVVDEQAQVRSAAIFGLGVLRDPEAEKDLLRVAAAGSRAEGVLAVEALGKLEVGLLRVLEVLTPLAEEERWARLLPHLWRFRPRPSEDAPSADEPSAEAPLSPAAFVAIALQGAEVAAEQPLLRARAVYALSRDPFPEALPSLRQLAADPDPRLRAWIARALGRVGGGAELPLLRAFLDDAAAAPIIHALQSAHRLITSGDLSAPSSWRPRLSELLRDPRPGVRLAAIEVAGPWVEAGAEAEAAGTVASELLILAGSDLQRERQLALLALASAGHPRTLELILETASASDAVLRAAAANAAASLLSGSSPSSDRDALEVVLESLAVDTAPGVRIAAQGAWLQSLDASADPAPLLRAALQDPDAAVRAAALSNLVQKPVLAFEILLRALEGAKQDPLPTARLTAVDALVARGEADSLERGSVVKALEALTAEEDFLLRRAAIAGLRSLGRPAPGAGSLPPTRDAKTYEQIVQRTRRERTVEIRTERGAVRVRLACPRVPLTCLSFLQLAGQGFYAGLPFHRVVPDFVVQGGDPRGDGYGGPGYQLRDEISPLRYDRGTIGMAHAGAHTAGSQFFITLAPQPHLEGTYTAFGQVVAGDEVLDRIVQGDRILEVVEVD